MEVDNQYAELTNGARFAGALINLGTEALRNELIKQVTNTYTDLQGALNASRVKPLLRDHFRRNILHAGQFYLLYPPNGATPNIMKYDITLLTHLLKNVLTEIVGNGVNVVPCNYSGTYDQMKADLDQIRKLRNNVYGHVTTTAMNEVEYETTFSDLSDILLRFGMPLVEINKWKEMTLSPHDATLWKSKFEKLCQNDVTFRDDLVKMVTNITKVVEGNQENLVEVKQVVKDNQLKLKSTSEIQEKVAKVVEGNQENLVEVKQVVKDNQLKLKSTSEIQEKVAKVVEGNQENLVEVKQVVKGNEEKLDELKQVVKDNQLQLKSTSEIQEKVAKSNETQVTHMKKTSEIHTDVKKVKEMLENPKTEPKPEFTIHDYWPNTKEWVTIKDCDKIEKEQYQYWILDYPTKLLDQPTKSLDHPTKSNRDLHALICKHRQTTTQIHRMKQGNSNDNTFMDTPIDIILISPELETMNNISCVVNNSIKTNCEALAEEVNNTCSTRKDKVFVTFLDSDTLSKLNVDQDEQSSYMVLIIPVDKTNSMGIPEWILIHSDDRIIGRDEDDKPEDEEASIMKLTLRKQSQNVEITLHFLGYRAFKGLVKKLNSKSILNEEEIEIIFQTAVVLQCSQKLIDILKRKDLIKVKKFFEILKNKKESFLVACILEFEYKKQEEKSLTLGASLEKQKYDIKVSTEEDRNDAETLKSNHVDYTNEVTRGGQITEVRKGCVEIALTMNSKWELANLKRDIKFGIYAIRHCLWLKKHEKTIPVGPVTVKFIESGKVVVENTCNVAQILAAEEEEVKKVRLEQEEEERKENEKIDEATLMDKTSALNEVAPGEEPLTKETLAEVTLEQEEKSSAPAEKTLAVVEKTSAPVEKTLAVVEKTSAPVEKTLAVVEKTSAPVEKTLAVVEKTSAPEEKTLALTEKTSAPVEKESEPTEDRSATMKKTSEAIEKMSSLKDQHTILLGQDKQQEYADPLSTKGIVPEQGQIFKGMAQWIPSSNTDSRALYASVEDFKLSRNDYQNILDLMKYVCAIEYDIPDGTFNVTGLFLGFVEPRIPGNTVQLSPAIHPSATSSVLQAQSKPVIMGPVAAILTSGHILEKWNPSIQPGELTFDWYESPATDVMESSSSGVIAVDDVLDYALLFVPDKDVMERFQNLQSPRRMVNMHKFPLPKTTMTMLSHHNDSHMKGDSIEIVDKQIFIANQDSIDYIKAGESDLRKGNNLHIVEQDFSVIYRSFNVHETPGAPCFSLLDGETELVCIHGGEIRLSKTNQTVPDETIYEFGILIKDVLRDINGKLPTLDLQWKD